MLLRCQKTKIAKRGAPVAQSWSSLVEGVGQKLKQVWNVAMHVQLNF